LISSAEQREEEMDTLTDPNAVVPGRNAATPMGNQAVIQLRKALGLPPDQPAPEDKVIQACEGKYGPAVQRMAQSIGAGGYGRPATNATSPTTPDQGQAGGESAPPNPGGPDTGTSPDVQPGARTEGKMGAATIFGRPPVSASGEQTPSQAGGPEDEEDDERPTSARIFGRR
jgi:hypothetical protein